MRHPDSTLATFYITRQNEEMRRQIGNIRRQLLGQKSQTRTFLLSRETSGTGPFFSRLEPVRIESRSREGTVSRNILAGKVAKCYSCPSPLLDSLDAEDTLHFRPVVYGRDHPFGQAHATGLPVRNKMSAIGLASEKPY